MISFSGIKINVWHWKQHFFIKWNHKLVNGIILLKYRNNSKYIINIWSSCFSLQLKFSAVSELRGTNLLCDWWKKGNKNIPMSPRMVYFSCRDDQNLNAFMLTIKLIYFTSCKHQTQIVYAIWNSTENIVWIGRQQMFRHRNVHTELIEPIQCVSRIR